MDKRRIQKHSQIRNPRGRCIDISLHKGRRSICKYLLKEDKEPEVWGEQIKAIAWAPLFYSPTPYYVGGKRGNP